ncbi:MAG: HemK2/MTQ2 family protein methyltransferase [Candidatus Aenigmatarchaeota archaeon]
MYQPREDSELMTEHLAKIIKKEKPKDFLDMGCGSCIQSKTAIAAGIPKECIDAVDIDESAVKEAEKLGVYAVKSDLFEFVEGRFDLIAFNPPYLPADEHDKGSDTTGGEHGWEIIEQFLKQARHYLTENGKILLLYSSLTDKKKVEELMKENGFSSEELAKKKLFMEELYVVLLKRKAAKT